MMKTTTMLIQKMEFFQVEHIIETQGCTTVAGISLLKTFFLWLKFYVKKSMIAFEILFLHFENEFVLYLTNQRTLQNGKPFIQCHNQNLQHIKWIKNSCHMLTLYRQTRIVIFWLFLRIWTKSNKREVIQCKSSYEKWK